MKSNEGTDVISDSFILSTLLFFRSEMEGNRVHISEQAKSSTGQYMRQESSFIISVTKAYCVCLLYMRCDNKVMRSVF